MTEQRSPVIRRTPGKRIALVLAIGVHLALAIFLIYGVQWQSKSPEAVEVDLIRAVPAPPPPPPPVAAPAPKPEPKPEPVPEPVVKPPPKPDIAIKEPKAPEKPQPRPEPKVVPKPEPKVVPKLEPKPEPRPDPFKEQLERETRQLDQRKVEASRDRELAEMKAAQASAARDKAMADWVGRIKGKIKGNIVLPPDVKGNPEAIFDVTQLPSGEIISVKLKKSSGQPALDGAFERAILKSSPLPKPEQGELFQRSLELKFRPLED